MAKWIKDFNPTLIAEKLEAAKSIKDGRVTFQAFIEDYVILLNSGIVLNEQISQREKQNIIRRAVVAAGQEGAITSQKILNQINELQTQYLTSPVKKFQIITSISLSHTLSLSRLSVDNCHISFLSNIPQLIQKEREKVLSNARHSVIGALPNNYKYVRISLSAKSIDQAVGIAFDALDLIRAVWNFYLNRLKGIRISSAKRIQVNDIVLGPIHTLHDERGKLATETWWFEPDYREPTKTLTQVNKMDKMYLFLSKIRAHLKRNNYASDLKAAIIRYGRALDLPNWEASFLQLWGTLEQLTGTTTSSYNVTVRRASFLFQDYEYHQQILSHLRDYRNRAVHAGTADNNIENHLFQLKRYVERLIEFHLATKIDFKNIAEATDFMDSPKTMEELDSKIKMLRRAKRFIQN